MKQLYELLANSEEWLTKKLLGHIYEEGLIEEYYPSCREEANIPLKAISVNMADIIVVSQVVPDIKALDELLFKHIAAVGIQNINKYAAKKIDVGTFLRTMKCYRRAFVDLVLFSKMDSDEKIETVSFIERFFDRLEIVSCSEWSKTAESEIKFNTLGEISSAFIFMYDQQKFIYVNNVAERFTGYTKEEMQEMHFMDIIHPEHREKIKALSAGGSEEMADTHELKIITKNGEERWIEYNEGVVDFGNKNLKLGIALDIQKRKTAEAALKDSEVRYQKLLELMPDAVVLYRGDIILYTNIAGAKLFGVEDAQELIGKKIWEYMRIHPQFVGLVQQQEDRVRREGALSLMERKYIRLSDEKQLEVEVAASTVPTQENTDVINIVRDISERKKMESLKETVKEKTRLLKQTLAYDQLKTEFFANISHELRTPLNVILSALQLIELLENQKEKDAVQDKEKMRKYQTMMKQNCYRLLRLVNNLIDITKIDAGYFQVSLQCHDIVQIIEDITLSVAEYVKSKEIQLVFDTEVEEKIISCDPDSIERIILNLLSNAIKFTQPGGNIVVSLIEKEDMVLVSVKDTGIGIPKQNQKNIFERFVQVDKTLTRKQEGSGIGLSLVKSLVEMHHGKITLMSEENQGSEFIIHFPIHKDLQDNVSVRNPLFIGQSNLERIHMEFSDIYMEEE